MSCLKTHIFTTEEVSAVNHYLKVKDSLDHAPKVPLKGLTRVDIPTDTSREVYSTATLKELKDLGEEYYLGTFILPDKKECHWVLKYTPEGFKLMFNTLGW